ncbi:MAG: hypothetical protein CYG59_09190, partial [Chloroflexi bacterium]
MHRTFAPSDWRAGEGVGLRCGRQADGSYLLVADYDGHSSDQDAVAAFNAALIALPVGIRQKLFTAISTGGKGRYIMWRSRRRVATRTLHDATGRGTGELRGAGAQVVAPSRDRWLDCNLPCLPILDDDEHEALLRAVRYPTGRTRAATAALDWQAIGARVPDVPTIMRRIGPHTLTYQHLHGDGGPDRSDRRWGVACALRALFGLPDDEIAAILWVYEWGHLHERGSERLRDDIARCIAGARKL